MDTREEYDISTYYCARCYQNLLPITVVPTDEWGNNLEALCGICASTQPLVLENVPIDLRIIAHMLMAKLIEIEERLKEMES